jgi:hypothetical protein
MYKRVRRVTARHTPAPGSAWVIDSPTCFLCRTTTTMSAASTLANDQPVKRKLRDPVPGENFSNLPFNQFLRLVVTDKTPDATKGRDLPFNEVLALTLNELAAANLTGDAIYGCDEKTCGGFFQHLPVRNSADKVQEGRACSAQGQVSSPSTIEND